MEERLLAALERLLQDDANITAVPVERLAREAGISRATFYLHFRDKSDLIERLIYRVEQDVIAQRSDPVNCLIHDLHRLHS